MKKKPHYSVPENYFDDLNKRLSEIPNQADRRSVLSRLTPYITLAACFILSVVIGNALLNRTAKNYTQAKLADTDKGPSSFNGDKTTLNHDDEDEIIEYLLVSDMPLAQIEDFMYNNQ